jgi:two-component system NtrC family sensor kinase
LAILKDIVQKALNSISDSEKNVIYNNWISYRDDKIDYALFLKILIPLSIILLVSIFWNRKLSKEVRRRKKAQAKRDAAYKKLEETQTQMVQSEKLATIGMLTAGIAHEIKNPVNYISGSIELIQDDIESIIQYADIVNKYISFLPAEKQKEVSQVRENLDYEHLKSEFYPLFESIKKGSKQIIEIAHGFNSFSIKANTEKQSYNLNSGIESTLVLLRNQYKYNIELVTDFGKIPEVKCFAGKINQVFLNIITNAIQAIEKKGEIHISTYLDNGYVKISIKDNGIGMEKEKQEKIFTPFFTTKSIDKGTGLGLAISKNIIEEHDGEIEVKSEPNVGTEFIVSLPIS